MIQELLLVLVAMFHVLLPHLRRIQCWCDHLQLSQISSQRTGSLLLAITIKYQTDMNIAAAWYLLIPPQQQPWAAFGCQMIYRWSSAWYVPRTWLVLCLQDLWDCCYYCCSRCWLPLQAAALPSSTCYWLLSLLPLQSECVTIFLLYTHMQTKYLMPMTPRFIVLTCWTVYEII